MNWVKTWDVGPPQADADLKKSKPSRDRVGTRNVTSRGRLALQKSNEND